MWGWGGSTEEALGSMEERERGRLRALQNNSELMQLSRTQEDEANQKIHGAESFNRTMGTEERGQ